MMRPTPCARCGGQVIEDRDELGHPEDTCLQCGAVSYPGHAALTVEEEKNLLRLRSIGRGVYAVAARPTLSTKLAKAKAQLRLMEA